MRQRVWTGCYDDGWRGNITPESFCHPAKMSYGLLTRIIRHGLAEGWWKPGDVIGDCFGGVGTTAIVGTYYDLRVVSVELEPKFHAMARENVELHRRKWEALVCALPVMLQGDSRRCNELVGPVAAVLASPPYAEGIGHDSGHPRLDEGEDARREREGCGRRMGYGGTPGQIGALKAGRLDSIISSPPYAETGVATAVGGNQVDYTRFAAHKDLANTRQRRETLQYGATPGQIGALKAGDLTGIVASPPFEKQQTGGGLAKPQAVYVGDGHKFGATHGYQNQAFSTGNVAAETGVSYWSAMRDVYASCFAALRPSGVACYVLKDYVKNKARVPLCDQTLELLQHLGFAPVERVRAMLVKERRFRGLHGQDIVETTERKSFFRRLAESKGSPRIDWEEVIVVRRPA